LLAWTVVVSLTMKQSMIHKLYCYVDETGQDTEGELFLVAVVLQGREMLDHLEQRLYQIEESSGKQLLKWKRTSERIKMSYLRALLPLKEIRGSIFYSVYHGTKEYSGLTALSIAKAVLAKRADKAVVTVIIDGLNDRERGIIRSELKKLKIRYKRVRGMRDEQSVFLRLADAMAGFLRDASEEEAYTRSLIVDFRKQGIITEA
jgi:hypothetical protein